MIALTSKIFIDLIGLYYCIKICSYRGVTWNIFKNITRKINQLSDRNKISIVFLWDKLKDLDDNEVREFMNRIKLNTGRGLHYAPQVETCREPSVPNCNFVICENHGAYCCMCGASKGDVLISMKAGSSVDCQIGNRDRLLFNDGIKEDSQEFNCEPDLGIGCPILVCNKIA